MKFLLIFSAVSLTVFVSSNAAISDAVSSTLGNSLSSLIQNAIEKAQQNGSFETINKIVQQLSSDASNEEASKLAINGFNEGMELLKKGYEVAFEGLKDIIGSLGSTNPENVTQSIKSTFGKFRELLIRSGAETYMTLGQVAQKLGQEDCLIEDAAQLLTASAQDIFDRLNDSMDMSIQGINGGKATIEGFLSTVKSIQSNEEGINNMVINLAETLKEALSKGTKPCTEDPEVVSRENEAAEKSQLAQNTIKSVNESADKALSKASTATQKEAIKVLVDGITKAIKKLAVAGVEGNDAIEEASSINNKNEAISTLEKGFKSAEKESISAVSEGQLTLGRVYAIMGDTFKSSAFEAMLAFESGRNELITMLEKTFKTASEQIRNNDTKTALEGARDGVEKAGSIGYSQFVKSTNMVLDSIVSAS